MPTKQAGKNTLDTGWHFRSVLKGDLPQIAMWIRRLGNDVYGNASSIEDKLLEEFIDSQRLEFPEYYLILHHDTPVLYVTAIRPSRRRKAPEGAEPYIDYRLYLLMNPNNDRNEGYWLRALETLSSNFFLMTGINCIAIKENSEDKLMGPTLWKLGFIPRHGWHVAVSETPATERDSRKPSFTRLDEWEAFKRMRAGDGEAFLKLFRRYLPTMMAYAMIFLKQDEYFNGRQIAAEALFCLWVKRDDFDKPKNAIAFLYITIRNNSLAFLRQRMRDSSLVNYAMDDRFLSRNPLPQETERRCRSIISNGLPPA